MNKFSKAVALSSLVALAACSDSAEDKEKTEATEAENAVAATVAPEASEAATALNAQFAFLEENKGKEGVLVTESGLQYRIIEEGAGTSPTADDFVEVHYAGRLIDGTTFDSSYDRDATEIFPAGRLIKGWTEALTMMKPGAKWELVIPAELGYGERGAGDDIPGGATLVFDIELMGIRNAEDAKAHQQARMEKLIEQVKADSAAFLTENAEKDGVQTTASGLQFKVLEEGTGKSPAATDTVTVHYAGRLINGAEFDSSYSRGEPIDFPLNGVIKGWTEGVQLMKEGAKYEFYIPPELGYGARGTRNIPPHAALIFVVELISVDS
jgi:FKBP-type peptidyl-prolyl cis-trans isomerase